MPFIIKGKDASWKEISKSVRRKVIAGKDVMVALYNAQPGPPGAPHKHDDVAQMVYLIQGKFEFEVNGEKIAAEAGDFLYFEPGVWHGGRILGDEMAITIDIFVPPMKDYLPEAVKIGKE